MNSKRTYTHRTMIAIHFYRLRFVGIIELKPKEIQGINSIYRWHFVIACDFTLKNTEEDYLRSPYGFVMIVIWCAVAFAVCPSNCVCVKKKIHLVFNRC